MSDIALTHLHSGGAAYMVDVTAKTPSTRQASATARVDYSLTVMTALRTGSVPKGDVLAVARVAGIAIAKRVPDLLPLAHTVDVHGCKVDFELEDDHVAIRSTVHTADRTGVEMEALTSVTACALTLINMVKGVDRSARTGEAKITSKSGGRSGEWTRPEDRVLPRGSISPCGPIGTSVGMQPTYGGSYQVWGLLAVCE